GDGNAGRRIHPRSAAGARTLSYAGKRQSSLLQVREKRMGKRMGKYWHYSVGTAVFLAGFCLAAPAAAATISVDCDAGGTITAAIAKARPGDTILTSGSCTEQVSFTPEMVRITLDGQKKTTIQHPG